MNDLKKKLENMIARERMMLKMYICLKITMKENVM